MKNTVAVNWSGTVQRNEEISFRSLGYRKMRFDILDSMKERSSRGAFNFDDNHGYSPLTILLNLLFFPITHSP